MASRRARPIVTQSLDGKLNIASSAKASVNVSLALAGKIPMASAAKATAITVPHIVFRPVEDIFAGLAGTVSWTIRYDVLDRDGSKQEELHPFEVGTITWDPSNRIQRILDGVRLDPTEVPKLTRGVSKIEPVFEVESAGYEYSMGRFTFFGGQRITVDGNEWLDCVPLWDRCYQLEQASRDPMGVDPSTLLTAALVSVAGAGGIPIEDMDVSSSTARLGAAPLAFPKGSGKTRMSLLRQIASLMGFLPPGFSQADRLVLRPVPQPDDEWPTFVYADGENATITGGSITENTAVADRPNVYQVLSSQPSSVQLSGEYQIPETFENSVANLGGIEIVASKTVDGFETAAQCAAAALAWAQQDYAVVQVLEWECDVPDPRHDQWDVCEVNGTRLLESWHQFDCTTGKTKHRAKKVYVDALT
jgi:hypothetical protein